MIAVALIAIGAVFTYVGYVAANDVVLVMGILSFTVGMVFALLMLAGRRR